MHQVVYEDCHLYVYKTVCDDNTQIVEQTNDFNFRNPDLEILMQSDGGVFVGARKGYGRVLNFDIDLFIDNSGGGNVTVPMADQDTLLTQLRNWRDACE
jgi:hypothetical protein